MIITEKDLETQYAHWFRNVKHPEEARKELLANLGQAVDLLIILIYNKRNEP